MEPGGGAGRDTAPAQLIKDNPSQSYYRARVATRHCALGADTQLWPSEKLR